jgi:D-alanine-D-alanine ligase
LGRESLVPALLDSYGIPYTFSDPMVLALTLHKAMAKRVVRSLGVPTPEFFVYDHYHRDTKGYVDFPLFVKPIAEGTSKGITGASKVSDRDELTAMCNTLLLKYQQPVLVEQYLPGRELTVGILGTGNRSHIVGVMEVLYRPGAEEGVYSFINKERCEELLEYRIVDDDVAVKASKFALSVWRGIGCRDAGRVDFRLDDKGIPNFLEVNPLAGLHPEHSDLCIIASLAGVSYRQLIASIIGSTMERYPLLGNHTMAVNE